MQEFGRPCEWIRDLGNCRFGLGNYLIQTPRCHELTACNDVLPHASVLQGRPADPSAKREDVGWLAACDSHLRGNAESAFHP